MIDPPLNNKSPQSRIRLRDIRNVPMHEVVLIKAGHSYIFRCAHGEEFALLTEIAALVRDPDTEINWHDAVLLAHLLGRRLGKCTGRLNNPCME